MRTKHVLARDRPTDGVEQPAEKGILAMAASLVSILARHGFWMAIPVFLIAAFLLALAILGLVRVVKRAYICSVPLAERQDVELTGQGRVVLWVEGPQTLRQRFAKRLSRLDFELDAPDGTPVKGRLSLSGSYTTGLTWARMACRILEIPAPGRYTLHVDGIEAAQLAGPEHKVVFTKPYLAQTVGYVLAIIAAATLLIGSIVLFGLSLALVE